jgi:hypothetical protein
LAKEGVKPIAVLKEESNLDILQSHILAFIIGTEVLKNSEK